MLKSVARIALVFSALTVLAQSQTDPLTQDAPALANRPADPVPTSGEYVMIVGGVSLKAWEKVQG
jgi:hypothetical protein